MRMIKLSLLSALLCASISTGLLAQENAEATPVDRNDPEEVFAYQGDAILTQEGIDAAFSRIPEANRTLFIRDGAKVDQMLRNLLKAKLVSADARRVGFDQDPMVQKRLQLAIEKELAEAWLDALVDQAPVADYEAMAREDYLAHPENYQKSLALDVTHILISSEGRGDEEALELATNLRAELMEDPSRFEEMVQLHSDDPAKKSNDGHYANMRRGQMVKPFENAAFALVRPGDISRPVKTEYGYHIIRLDARKGGDVPPWEEIEAEAVTKAKQRYEEIYRGNYLQKLFSEKLVIPEGAVEIMAKRHFGENLEKAPVFDGDKID